MGEINSKCSVKGCEVIIYWEQKLPSINSDRLNAVTGLYASLLYQ